MWKKGSEKEEESESAAMKRRNGRLTNEKLVTKISSKTKIKRMQNKGKKMRAIELYCAIQKYLIPRFF
jgi:hypothetical protein